MPWAQLSALPTWNVTDIELINRLIYMLLENGDADANATFITTMFDLPTLVDSLNKTQQQFIKDTACIRIHAAQGSTPGQNRYKLPDSSDAPTCVLIRRLTWQQNSQSIKAMCRMDSYQLDHGLSNWEANPGLPFAYNDGSNLPTLSFDLAPAPNQIGSMILDYVPIPATLNGQTGTPVNINIPDECETALLHGVLSDLLAVDTEAADPERSEYSQMRYDLACEMTKLLIESYKG